MWQSLDLHSRDVINTSTLGGMSSISQIFQGSDIDIFESWLASCAHTVQQMVHDVSNLFMPLAISSKWSPSEGEITQQRDTDYLLNVSLDV